MSDYCEIVVKDHLDKDWSGWFDGMNIAHNDDDETLLSGPIRDQAAFYGLLARVRDMGLFLIMARYVTVEAAERAQTLSASRKAPRRPDK